MEYAPVIDDEQYDIFNQVSPIINSGPVSIANNLTQESIQIRENFHINLLTINTYYIIEHAETIFSMGY